MAINKKLIHFKNKQTFESEVANENILDTSIVFIQDSKEISTHGTVYKTVNWSILTNPSQEYTTFTALENGTFSFTKKGTGDNIQYSKDNGTTWTSLASGNTVSVVTGDKVLWKSTITPKEVNGIGIFSSSNKFNVSGNIMSLLYGDDFKNQTNLEGKNFAFYSLFKDNGGLIDISNLKLPATTLCDNCYYYMFSGCTNLTTVPKLPAIIVAASCYYRMFYNCINLTTAPELPATTLANMCYSNMFEGCTGLTTAPELPATTLVNMCYYSMFTGCTNLNHITMLATDISASDCLYSWVSGVSSNGTFVKNPAMTSLPSGESGIPINWTVEDAVIS